MNSVFNTLESFKFSCYLTISVNCYKIIITIIITFWDCQGLSANLLFFYISGCLFPLKSRNIGLQCSCMNLLFHQQIDFYPFYSVCNEYYKENILWTCYGCIGIFSYIFRIFFWERLLSLPIRKQLLFLDIARPKHFTELLNSIFIFCSSSLENVISGGTPFTFTSFDHVKVKMLNWNFWNFESF